MREYLAIYAREETERNASCRPVPSCVSKDAANCNYLLEISDRTFLSGNRDSEQATAALRRFLFVDAERPAFPRCAYGLVAHLAH